MSDLDTPRPEVTGYGPCKLCGTTGYALSYGGMDICPACDTGVNPEVTKLKRELLDARAELLLLINENADLSAQVFGWKSECGRAADWKRRAEKAEAELAALKARIAEQPANPVDRSHEYVQSKEHGGCSECGYPEWEPWHRLALVKVED